MSAVKKLKHLRRLIKNIPKENIDLTAIITTWNSDWTECVMCVAGWIASDPFLARDWMWIEETGYGGADVRTKENCSFPYAVREILGIDHDDAWDLVYSDAMNKPLKEHKRLILNYIETLIKKYSDLE